MKHTTLLQRYAELQAQRDTSPQSRIRRTIRLAYFAGHITLDEYRACAKVLGGVPRLEDLERKA